MNNVIILRSESQVRSFLKRHFRKNYYRKGDRILKSTDEKLISLCECGDPYCDRSYWKVTAVKVIAMIKPRSFRNHQQ
jgi:hypothetical protein